MPMDSIIVLAAIATAFVVFAITLMWADLHSRQTGR
jgi:hypothetical protein